MLDGLNFLNYNISMDITELRKIAEAYVPKAELILEQAESGDEHAENLLTFILSTFVNLDSGD